MRNSPCGQKRTDTWQSTMDNIHLFTLRDFESKRDATEYTTPATKLMIRESSSEAGARRKIKPEKEKNNWEPNPLDLDDYVSEEENEDVDYASEVDEEISDDEDDDREDPDYDPSQDSSIYSRSVKQPTLYMFAATDDDSSYEDDVSSSQPGHFTLRTLKNFGIKAADRRELRKKYVIAEAADPKVVLRKVQRALKSYSTDQFFPLRKRGSKDKEAFCFVEELGQMCLEKIGRYKCPGLKAARIKATLEVIEQLLLDDDTKSRRENIFHYICKKDVQEAGLKESELQKRFIKAISEISVMLCVSRESLKIRPSAKGLIKGDVKLYTADGLLLDCKYGGISGNMITSETDLITKIEIAENIKCVIVLEKDTAFYELTGKNFPESEECILVTGKGQPDVATRILLRKLKDEKPEIPMFCMVDYNPSGMLILATYCFGSEQRSHDNLFLIVPAIEHIGLRRIHVDGSDFEKLNDDDCTKMENMLNRSYLEKTNAGVAMRSSLLEMKYYNEKADIDVLIRKNQLAKVIKDAINSEV